MQTMTLALNEKRNQARAAWQAKQQAPVYITIGMGTCGLAAGAGETAEAIRKELETRGIDAVVSQVGCVGMCSYEPMVEIQAGGRERINYGYVTRRNVKEIFRHYFDGGKLKKATIVGQAIPTKTTSHGHELHSLSFVVPGSQKRIPFQAKQQRIVLSNCGLIDPESIEDYLAVDGYSALERALTQMTPEEVIQEVTNSGLRGRGGGGFPTGVKWKFARKTPKHPKFVICNADEGDPGAFMDRSVLEGDPHSLIEGMIIAAYAIGAEQGYIYVRAEYPLAIRRLRIAMEQAQELGLLGDDILGSGFNFRLAIYEGAGAFVCGEETALMNSIMGQRGQPWPRPPYPAVSGLWEKPSNINNVKSYAYTPRILRMGADWFRSIGTENSPGTAVFALTGQVQRTGLIEVPMGITLREIIEDVGGGVGEGKSFKAVQTGGPLGGALPEAYLDTAVDFDSLRAAGAVMGSGGMIVANENTCMVEFAKYFMQFVVDESCGKCPPCRIGSIRMLEILERITEGKGELSDIDELKRLSAGMQAGSLCGLGQLAPSPVLSILRHFEDEFRAHIEEKKCPARTCEVMINYEIIAEDCVGCTVCARNCPVNAISGEKNKVHIIDPEICIRCGMCYEVCNFDSIVITTPRVDFKLTTPV